MPHRQPEKTTPPPPESDILQKAQERRANKTPAGLLHKLAKPIPFGLLLLTFILVPLIALLSYWRSQQLPDPTTKVEKFYQAILEKDSRQAQNILIENKRQRAEIALKFVMLNNVYLEYQVLEIQEMEKEENQPREESNVRVNGVATYNYQGTSSEITFSEVIKLKLIDDSWYMENASLGDLFTL